MVQLGGQAVADVDGRRGHPPQQGHQVLPGPGPQMPPDQLLRSGQVALVREKGLQPGGGIPHRAAQGHQVPRPGAAAGNEPGRLSQQEEIHRQGGRPAHVAADDPEAIGRLGLGQAVIEGLQRLGGLARRHHQGDQGKARQAAAGADIADVGRGQPPSHGGHVRALRKKMTPGHGDIAGDQLKSAGDGKRGAVVPDAHRSRGQITPETCGQPRDQLKFPQRLIGHARLPWVASIPASIHAPSQSIPWPHGNRKPRDPHPAATGPIARDCAAPHPPWPGCFIYHGRERPAAVAPAAGFHSILRRL